MKIINDDCLHAMAAMKENSVDTIITDPPYGLSFMGKGWDHGVPGVDYWSAALRVAKPGAMLLAFGGTRTFHRLACAIEDAGWQIRDCLMWLYSSGFPKSLDISKAIDKSAGVQREVIGYARSINCVERGYDKVYATKADNSGYGTSQTFGLGTPITSPATDLAKLWQGYGTALKPAWEPILLAMKQCEGTYAANAAKHGVAGLNIDECRIAGEPWKAHNATGLAKKKFFTDGETPIIHKAPHDLGRWPANVVLDEEAGALLDQQSGTLTSERGAVKRKSAAGSQGNALGRESRPFGTEIHSYGDSGGASRFFYCAKASKKDRGEDNNHPTVKPLALMQYLVRLTKTPSGGIVLDPFAGSGTTGLACEAEGRECILIEQDAAYCDISRRRIAA